MKNVMAGLVALAVVATFAAPSYAKDKEWANAGKVLAIIEGARILTGGNMDLIGNVTGINRSSWNQRGHENHRRDYARSYSSHEACVPTRVWVPNYIWERKNVPEHEEYIVGYGTIIVEAHYIRYRVESGGRWE